MDEAGGDPWSLEAHGPLTGDGELSSEGSPIPRPRMRLKAPRGSPAPTAWDMVKGRGVSRRWRSGPLGPDLRPRPLSTLGDRVPRQGRATREPVHRGRWTGPAPTGEGGQAVRRGRGAARHGTPERGDQTPTHRGRWVDEGGVDPWSLGTHGPPTGEGSSLRRAPQEPVYGCVSRFRGVHLHRQPGTWSKGGA